MWRKLIALTFVLLSIFVFAYFITSDYRRLTKYWGEDHLIEIYCYYTSFDQLEYPGLARKVIDDTSFLTIVRPVVVFRTEHLGSITKTLLSSYHWPQSQDQVCSEELASQVDSLWADSEGFVVAGYGAKTKYPYGEPQATGDGSYFLADKRGQPPHFFKTKVELDSALGFLVELRPIQDLIVKTVP